MPARTATRRAVHLAKLAVFWDDETPNAHLKLFPYDNDPSKFYGTEEELHEIRAAMKRYEEQAAGPGEDRAFYNGRFELQFVETGGDD